MEVLRSEREDGIEQAATASAEPKRSLSGGMVALMAAASGFAAANLYYNQPLLAQIARSLRVTHAHVGILPPLSQMGYATGLFLLVPLGDILERRRLITTLYGCVTLFLLLAACSPTLPVLAFATYAMGVSTIMGQILIPFAVHLSPPSDRGRVVGGIMGGLLVGILLSRTVSGFVGDWLGWRAMYFLAAGTMIAIAGILRFRLPESRAVNALSYPQLMRSLVTLVREQPVLRQAAINGAFVFATFSAFWATLVFLLDSPAYHLGAKEAGLFGLVGASGALAAPIVGKLADKRSPRLIVGAATLVILASYLLFWRFGLNLWGLLVGVILMDAGVQSAHIANQSRVYGLLPNAQSRLNTVYMTSYFVGGSAGSYLGALGWNRAGWHGVCAVGIGVATMALLLHGWAGRTGAA